MEFFASASKMEGVGESRNLQNLERLIKAKSQNPDSKFALKERENPLQRLKYVSKTFIKKAVDPHTVGSAKGDLKEGVSSLKSENLVKESCSFSATPEDCEPPLQFKVKEKVHNNIPLLDTLFHR